MKTIFKRCMIIFQFHKTKEEKCKESLLETLWVLDSVYFA